MEMENGDGAAIFHLLTYTYYGLCNMFSADVGTEVA